MKITLRTLLDPAAVWPATPRGAIEELVPRDRDWTSELTQDSPLMAPGYQSSTARPAWRVAGLLALVQSAVFLAIWLLVCASAGAETDSAIKTNSLAAEVKLSVYQPAKTRDPFTPVTASTGGVPEVALELAEGALQLEGILYSPSQPMAVINGKLVSLNRNVSLPAGDVDITVRATEITRDRVRLLVQGQTIELRLPAPGQAAKPRPAEPD